MPCKRCLERGKNWDGDDPKCAFPSGVFQPDNWNCATANAIRNICEHPRPDGVDYRYCDDMQYATIYTDHISERSTDGTFGAYCLWVLWYKSRGRTDQILAMGDGGATPITEDEAGQVIRAYATEAK